MRWGATDEEWVHFDLMLGLTADLLPVVSNPGAEISPQSKMKGLGKTPSVYNQGGKVAGIPDWTAKRTTPAEIARWMRQPDYGICVQTRHVRALDIDIEDEELADAIEQFWRSMGTGDASPGDREALHPTPHFPARRRHGSGKRLLVFMVGEPLGKRSFKCEGGLVELLADGQQFVACGTHTRGQRYEWTGGLPADIPILTLAQVDALWAALVARFATEPERVSDRSQRQAAADLDIEDEVAAFAEDHWTTYGVQGGKLFVECPWKDGHSVDSGESETAWLLAGTRGYQRGHFECLHASCQGRTDEDFMDAIGYRVAEFDVIEQKAAPAVAEGGGPGWPFGAEGTPWPALKRDSVGRIEPTAENLSRILLRPDVTGLQLRHDTFRDELMVADAGGVWRPVTDGDNFQLRVTLEQRGFKPIGKELMRDAMAWVAEREQFDTAIHWLETLPPWDGKPRIDRFFPVYFNTVFSPYTCAVSLYTWTALVGRVLRPGIKADMAPVLVGEQGLRKSSGIEAMAPTPSAYAEINLAERDDNLSRKMRGLLVAELAELRGLNSRDAESIKAWMVQKVERWTPKYKEYETTYARRCLFFGTNNPHEFLADDTGERRWLPMVSGRVDVEGIERDRDQLWAEAKVRFEKEGIAWKAAETLAKAEHFTFKIGDVWEPAIERWLATPDHTDGSTPLSRGRTTALDVLEGALGVSTSRCSRGDEMRVGKVLRALGWVSVVRWVDGKSKRVWELEGDLA